MSTDGEKNSTDNRAHPRTWKYSSPDEPGLHLVVGPHNSVCRVTYAYRLNLNAGEKFNLVHQDLELNAAIIAGETILIHEGKEFKLGKFDSVYLPAGSSVQFQAISDLTCFVGGGPYEGTGDFFVRQFEPELPLGEVHQIHGEPPFEREVFMTLNQEMPASRMINGFTWGATGMWTSWPPHQHTKDLEEVYCYFDLPAPKFALHLSSRIPGEIEAVHPVSSGDFIIVPEGYHPTVGSPGSRSCYFWIMVAHSSQSRSYDLAISDF